MTRAASIAMVTLLGLSGCGASRGPDAEVPVVDTTPTQRAQASPAPEPEGPADEPEDPIAKVAKKRRPPPEEPPKVEPARTVDADVQAARGLFKQGVAAYANQDYAAAKKFWEQAYALAPENAILFNIASAELRLGQTQIACKHFKDYVAAGDPGSQRTQQVQQQVQGRCP